MFMEKVGNEKRYRIFKKDSHNHLTVFLRQK